MAAELERTEQVRAKIQIKNPLLRNALSEFFGTFLLLFIGIGIVMQFILSNEKLNTWINVCFRLQELGLSGESRLDLKA